MTDTSSINPFFARQRERRPTGERPEAPAQHRYAKLPAAPMTGSPVPHLTSLYHFDDAGGHGDRRYPGNCGGQLIRDLVRYFGPRSVFDPMTGSGTCRQVCQELGVYCLSRDLHQGFDACDATMFPRECFDFCWLHPPYWRMKLYSDDPRDLSRAPTLPEFLTRYQQVIANCAGALAQGGKLAILMGELGNDRDEGYVPLVYWTKRLAFEAGLRQSCTDIVRFIHASSSHGRTYRRAFIPILHDVCMVFEKQS